MSITARAATRVADLISAKNDPQIIGVRVCAPFELHGSACSVRMYTSPTPQHVDIPYTHTYTHFKRTADQTSSAGFLIWQMCPLKYLVGLAKQFGLPQISQSGGVSFEVGLRTRGCNGLTYTMDYAKQGEIGKFDEVASKHGMA